jgi:hypothetical protein
MKLLLNDKEIANFLYSLIDHSAAYKNVTLADPYQSECVLWWLSKKDDAKFIKNIEKHKNKLKERIIKTVRDDLKTFMSEVEKNLKIRKEFYNLRLYKNVNFFINKLGEEKILNLYRNSRKEYFVKSVGLSIDPAAKLIRRHTYSNFQEDCLFRNMDGNENLLLEKMNNKWPFWFIDTGYTNFLHGKQKVWHRLVRNNLHHSNFFEAPVDRLGIFESFPQPWRTSGDKILIIEPGNFCAKTFGIDIDQWKKSVEAELRQYTDKKIVIREKLGRKVRKNLYKELCDDDYYCVININSNAATEAIWAGVPAITLDRHVSNSVTKNSLSDINNLYRGNIANWLCMLSYSQFTYEELLNGTATNILKKYHV